DPAGRMSGGNLLARWSRRMEDGSSVQAQTYYDRVDRSSPGVTDEIGTFDIEARHDFSIGSRHRIVWGGGYRHTEDEFANTLNAFVLDPESDSVELGNLFVQDSIALSNSLAL